MPPPPHHAAAHRQHEQELETYLLACQALHTQPLEAMVEALTHKPAADLTRPANVMVTLPSGTNEVEVCAVALTLSRSHLVHGLHMPASCPGMEGMRQLGQALAENEVLHTLSFTDASFAACSSSSSTSPTPSAAADQNEHPFLVFTTELKQNLASSALRHLTLRHCQLTVEHVDALVECLIYLPHLGKGSLDLSHNPLPPEAALLLSKVIRASNGPGRLDLSHNCLGDAGAAAVGGALAADLPSSSSSSSSSPPHYRQQSSYGSMVGGDGCLKQNFLRPWTLNLTSLDLGYNQIGDEGLAELVKGVRIYTDLHNGCPIKELILDGNEITDEGVLGQIHCLFPPLSAGLGLRKLGLAYNKLRGDGFHALAEVVGAEGGHVQLEQLDLRGNRVRAEGLQSLSLMLGERTTLREFALTLPAVEEGEERREGGREEEAAVFEMVNTAACSKSLVKVSLEGSRRYLTQELAQAIMRMEGTLAVNRRKKEEEEEEEEEEGREEGRRVSRSLSPVGGKARSHTPREQIKSAKATAAVPLRKKEEQQQQQQQHVPPFGGVTGRPHHSSLLPEPASFDRSSTAARAATPPHKQQQQQQHVQLHFGGVTGRPSHFSCLNESASFDRPSSRIGGGGGGGAAGAGAAGAARAAGEKSKLYQRQAERSMERKGRREGEEEDEIPITARAMGKCFSNRMRPASRNNSTTPTSSSKSSSSNINSSSTFVTAHQHHPTVHACCAIPEQENERRTPHPPTTYSFHRATAAAAAAAAAANQGQGSMAEKRKNLNPPPPGVLRSTVSAALKQQSKHNPTSGTTAAGFLTSSPPRKYNNNPMPSPPKAPSSSTSSSGYGRRSPPPAQQSRRTSTAAMPPPVRTPPPPPPSPPPPSTTSRPPMKQAMSMTDDSMFVTASSTMTDMSSSSSSSSRRSRATSTASAATTTPTTAATAAAMARRRQEEEDAERRRQVEKAAGRYNQDVFALTEHAASLEVELRETQERLLEEERMHNEIMRLIVELLTR